MKNTIKILLICLTIASISSCKKFLDQQPTNQLDASTTVRTPADAQTMLNGIYRAMTNLNYYGRIFVLYGDAKGGDFVIPTGGGGRGDDALYAFNHSATGGSYVGTWSQIYFTLLEVNTLLQNIANLEAGGTIGFDLSKGQALTLRAMMYFDLVRLYGLPYNDDKSSLGVPNITTPLLPSAQPLRNTVAENYTQILSDLQAAAPLLPQTKANGVISYYANIAEQARVYLYMNDYTNALAKAQEIINSNVYTLYAPADWVNSWKSQFGSESIFELGIYPDGDLGAASLGAYERAKGDGGSAYLGQYLASDYFLDRLYQDPTDVRWGVMKADEDSLDANSPIHPRKGAIYKYSGSTTLSGDGKSTSTAVNIKVIRLSEIYLIAAEAALQTGDAATAATYVNAIRQRAPALAPATAATVSINTILDERSKELLAEGQRFFDMMRLNQSITFDDEFYVGSVSRPKTIDRTFNKIVLPISQTEINANPGIQQNQGY
ncbi:MAG: RagB/SusD family nutrient uptake outer membrane protein [Chitinophagaceae bacterium]|jgi:hypothetical protein|nr:RagB/SusD family nutrient uptake outer membrane protein [Chitinophagaceae bacterium]